MRRLEGRIKKLEERVQARQSRRDLARFRNDPVGYARHVLGVEPWGRQIEIAEALLRPPYRVLAKSSHSVGKTWTEAWLASWFFDTRPTDCAVLTTAPTSRDVCDLLWAEVRQQRARAGLGGLRGSRAPEIYDGPRHWAKGFTAERGESFQGRHLQHMLFLFDEAVGIDPVFWQTTATMFDPSGNHAWLCCFNPTDTTSQAYLECTKDSWTVIEMGSPDHPNLHAQLQGQPTPYPGAVTLQQFESWLTDWCEPIPLEEATATDLEWPPGSGVYYRPGPEMEARALGRWPSQATYNVWSDALWQACTLRQPLPLPRGEPLPEIGGDIARFGDDDTELHGRWGGCSLIHERHHGWSTDRTTGRLIELAAELAEQATRHRDRGLPPVNPKAIPIKVDDDGVGGGVTDQLRAAGYHAVPVGAGSSPIEAGRYPNRRSELWFAVQGLARSGQIDLTRLDRATLTRLRQQATAPRWSLDAAGRRVVEAKHQTKQRLRCSPDAMDALNLAYAPSVSRSPARVGPEREGSSTQPRKGSAQERRGLYGR